TGQQRSLWNGSSDGGHTYRLLSPAPPSALIGLPNQPGGGDTDIAFDHAGKQYFSDLYALLCFRMAVTADDGAHLSPDIFPGGYPAVDQVTGKVLEAAGTGTHLLLNIGTPDVDGNLTFLDDPGQGGLIHIADSFPAHPGAQPDDLFSVVSMDSARNLWVVTG